MADRIDVSSTQPTRRADAARPGGTTQTENRNQPVSEPAAPTATQRDSEVAGNLIRRLQEEVSGSNEVDRQKVESIKQAISSGEFQIDAGRVASAFIQVEALLA